MKGKDSRKKISTAIPDIDITREFTEISGKLVMLGLSPYEAKAYVALVAHGCGDANTIAKTASIPRTSSYKILESLKSKGFAIATSGRPVIYKPEAPDNIKDKYFSELDTMFEKLELLHEIVRERGEPQLVYTITSKEKVLDKIGELLDKATRTFIISTPRFSEIKESLTKKIQNAIKRGLEITIVTAPLQKIPEQFKAKNVKLIRKKGLLATDVICDNEKALIAAPDLDACGYTDNAILAAHLERFLQILIKH
jgi:sugar-specific transcriptional regulator TrmB